MVRKCARCGSEASDLARFCSNCGTPLAEALDTPEDATGKLEIPVSSTGPLGPVLGQGAPPGTAVLIVRRGPSEGTTLHLSSDLTRIGRSDESDIVLDDVTVSRHHAEVTRNASGWGLRDAGSLNGTYVNRERIDYIQLSGGDEVQIGKYRFLFLAGEVRP